MFQLNPSVSSFQRRFVSEIKRCEEMERILGKGAPEMWIHGASPAGGVAAMLVRWKCVRAL